MMSRALYQVALGLAASMLAVQAHAGNEPLVLNALQMDGVTASAAAPADRGETAGRWYSITSAFSDGGASLGGTSPETGGTFGLSTGPALSAGGADLGSHTISAAGSVSGGGISRSVTSSGLGAMATSSSASAFGTGPSSVFVSSTTFAPGGTAMSALSSSLARSSSFADR
jgi:hypothetical protein